MIATQIVPQLASAEVPPADPPTLPDVARPPAPADGAAPVLGDAAPAPPPEAPPPDPVTECKLRRSALMRDARSTSVPRERQQILTNLPDCDKLAAELAVPPPMSTRHPRRGAIGEVSAGLGLLTGGGDALKGLAYSFGGGAFVSPNLALMLRASGTLVTESGAVFSAAFIGPYVVGWLAPRVFAGGGIGLGLLAGCGSGCGSFETSAVSLRLGLSFDETGHGAYLALETSQMMGDLDITSVGLTIGYFGF